MSTLDVDQAAALLHLQPKRVRSLAREGKLPGRRVGRRWLFQRSELERMVGGVDAPRPASLAGLSARNHLRGVIRALHVDGLMAEVHLDVGGQPLISIITRSSAERLGLAVGSEVFAVIKSTEVMIGTD